MSATNHTTTIELSQYISTDKPTYLTDYNGDMLKIDNAIAADRDSISTAQNKANTADGKADANKLSIDTINAQLNGDPTDPEDTGMAGKVTALEGNVNTINSLIGNGTPTTSDQTIIGAVNGLEGAIAPREDSANLANSYASGEQFARGGSVYTALTSLTAGTAFASLTLNTDYKNSDTLVEQIADVESTLSTQIANSKRLTARDTHLDVTDSTMTVSAFLDSAYAAFKAVTDTFSTVKILNFYITGGNTSGYQMALRNQETTAIASTVQCYRVDVGDSGAFIDSMSLKASGSTLYKCNLLAGGTSFTNIGAETCAANGITQITMFYEAD